MEQARDNTKDRFPRWQQTTIEQMGYFINLIIVLCLGTIGFCVSKLLDFNIIQNCSAETLVISGTTFLLVSLSMLIYVQYNRLLDFRITSQLSRRNDKPSHTLLDTPENLRNRTKKLGRLTWRIFDISLIFFALGQLFVVLGFMITILSK